MATCLYLDTARLGQMCPEAQRADRDFARLAGEEAGSPYYDHFLRAGFYSLPPSIRSRYSGLRDWSGVASLKNRIKTALGLSADRPLLLANRSAVLVRLACRALYRRCENVLVTDMLWPAYRAILEDECQRQRRTLTTVPLKDAILRDRMGQMELIDHVLDRYSRESCDGLFLSAVTCQGVRLPIPELVAAMRSIQRPRFVVVDAAQAVNHVPLHLANSSCDFLIAGCHKWLRAYHPMGIGICSHSATDSTVAQVPSEMTGSRDHDDPLLRFTRELENQCCHAFDETVNLAPLFTAAAAVGRIWHSSVGRVRRVPPAGGQRRPRGCGNSRYRMAAGPSRGLLAVRHSAAPGETERNALGSARCTAFRAPPIRHFAVGVRWRSSPSVVPGGSSHAATAESTSLCTASMRIRACRVGTAGQRVTHENREKLERTSIPESGGRSSC